MRKKGNILLVSVLTTLTIALSGCSGDKAGDSSGIVSGWRAFCAHRDSPVKKEFERVVASQLSGAGVPGDEQFFDGFH